MAVGLQPSNVGGGLAKSCRQVGGMEMVGSVHSGHSMHRVHMAHFMAPLLTCQDTSLRSAWGSSRNRLVSSEHSAWRSHTCRGCVVGED